MKVTTLIPTLLILFSILSGCATTHGEKISGVQIGMTKGEVIKVMGSPSSVSAKDDMEYLKYNVGISQLLSNSGGASYYVRLIRGKVESFGEVGHFDNAKNN